MANDIFPGAKLMQLVEWGYPKGSPRPAPPADKAFSVIHITGNSRLPSAEAEATWRINDPGLQNSATFFVNRNGSIVQTLGDPLHMDPWANGDVNRPDTANPRIAAVVRDGVNANERTILAIENVGYEPGSSITPAQDDACARLIAYYHAKAGVPITRETVIGHYQLNSVSRPNCPARDKSVIDRIVVQAAGTEDDMILLPIKVYEPGTKAIFTGGVTYDLYRIVDGEIKRAQFKPNDPGSSAEASAIVALNGDVEHAGILLHNGFYAGWVVSGWGEAPRIEPPPPPGLTQEAKDELLVDLKVIERRAAKLGDSIRNL